jgi:hypothetical protein
MAKHYCYGSGMHGCLYDYGPNFCEDKNDAIEDLLLLFPLEDGEPARMRANLESDGYHKFENPGAAGAHYCDISEHEGECPEQDED